MKCAMLSAFYRKALALNYRQKKWPIKSYSFARNVFGTRSNREPKLTSEIVERVAREATPKCFVDEIVAA